MTPGSKLTTVLILIIRGLCFLRFVNVGFTVMSGANLVFDMPKTKFGPNTEVGTVKCNRAFAPLDPPLFSALALESYRKNMSKSYIEEWQ